MWAVSLFLHPAQRQKAITAFMIYFPSCPVPCSHLSSSCARPRRSRRRRRAWWASSRCSARSWSTWSSCPTCCSGSCAAGTSCSRYACCWTFWLSSEITTRLSPRSPDIPVRGAVVVALTEGEAVGQRGGGGGVGSDMMSINMLMIRIDNK